MRDSSQQALTPVPQVSHSNNEPIGASLLRYLLTATQRLRAIFIRHTAPTDYDVRLSSPVQLTIPPLVHYGHSSLRHDGIGFLNNFIFSLVCLALFLSDVHNPRNGKFLVHFIGVVLAFSGEPWIPPPLPRG